MVIEIKSGSDFRKQQRQADENITGLVCVPQYLRAYWEVQESLREFE